MRKIVFYSWQSDLPNSTNRGFIQAALEDATNALTLDNTIEVEPVIDRDTQGVPGSPDIAATIFAKITAADVFVADVSIVTRALDARSTPNPNVLIELGYALKALGHEKIVLVLNKAYGKIEELPFDLRTRRVLNYELSKDDEDRAAEKRKLKEQLQEAVRIALTSTPEEPTSLPVVDAIENASSNRIIILRRSLDEIIRKLDVLEPKKHRDGGTADELMAGIDKTQEIIAEFSKIIEAAAVVNDEEVLIDAYRWLGKIFDRYNLPDGYSGRSSEADHDYFKFLGHELFITVIAFLLREQRWETLLHLLNEPIVTRVPNRGQRAVDWEYASEHLSLLIDESSKRRRVSLHADILKKRHDEGGGLSAVMPLKEFMDADYFMFLLSQTRENEPFRYWRAWSCLYLKNTPLFIVNSERKTFAENLVKVLMLKDIDELKKLLSEHGEDVGKIFRNGGIWHLPVLPEDIERIGKR